MKVLFLILVLLSSPLHEQLFGQNDVGLKSDSIEVYIIDSYVPPESPNRFILSFYTNEVCKSKVILDQIKEIPVSNELTDNHRIEIDIAKLSLKKNKLKYVIEMENAEGIKSTSEVFEVDLHKNEEMVQTKTNYLFTCLVGGIVFLTPSITAIQSGGKTYYGLNKELPIVSLFSGGFNHPSDYLSVEYAHISKAERKNYFRIGYKHIYEIPILEYISAGLNGFTDFRGFNGLSPELSLGMVNIYDVFTLYSRYRYNFSPGKKGQEFSEISIGLYSSFFTLHW